MVRVYAEELVQLMRAELDNAVQDRDELKAQLEISESDLESSNDNLAAYMRECEDMQPTLRRLNHENSMRRRQIQELETRCAHYRNVGEGIRIENKSLRDQLLSDRDSTIMELKIRIDVLQDKNEKFYKEIKEKEGLEKALFKRAEENMVLQRDLAAEKQKSKKVAEAFDELQKELDETEDEYEPTDTIPTKRARKD